jgi:Alpha/beta hydrolase of unknown function (DUF900)
VSHFITVPINANGIIFDTGMNGVVAEAIAEQPFGFQDVYVYSHGWSTDAFLALDEYNRFSVELSKTMLLTMAQTPAVLKNPPRDSLGVGIHWPSEITEDPNSVLNDLQLFTFYSMEHRADAVGKNAVYSMLRLMLSSRAGSALPLRLFILGHSFGSKVVCSALNDLRVDIANGTIAVPASLSFRVVLLEAATDNNNLEPGDIYGAVVSIPNLRMLVTTSRLDKALQTWYPAASKLADLFHHGTQIPALGAAGPTAATQTAFGGASSIAIPTGFTAGTVPTGTRLVVADLTPVHQDRVNSGAWTNAISGSHSDINFAEVYQLVMGFLFS